MIRAIHPRAVRLYRIEKQDLPGSVPARMRYDRDPIAQCKRSPTPSLTDHDADARGFDIPGAYGGRVGGVRSYGDDDVAVRVLPLVLLDEASIGNIFRHIEHRAGVMSERRIGYR